MLVSIVKWSICFIFSLPSLSSAQSLSASETNPSTTITSAPLLTATATYDSNELGCISQFLYETICNSLTPGFSTLTNFDNQAPCLCYSSTAWVPSIYDNFVSSCFQYYKTASPSFYASLTYQAGGSPVSTPCHKAGDVVAQLSSYEASASTTFNNFWTATPTTTSTTSAVPTSTAKKNASSKIVVSPSSSVIVTDTYRRKLILK
ncbi:hypothetical protein N431DRAFT_433162 [Stipitochalara longipes BDJ]|nr:hypothetical protein N431DRAFT_433162 [Stipitochalara longipes BDJ]